MLPSSLVLATIVLPSNSPHHGRNHNSKTAKRRRCRHPAQILQENSEREGHQRCISSLLIISSRMLSANFRSVIRERYLRDDVVCGLQGCRVCSNPEDSSLPRNGATDHKQFPQGHFILPDTNVFLAQVRVLFAHTMPSHLPSKTAFCITFTVPLYRFSSLFLYIDGPDGIYSFHSPYHPSPNCLGRSQTSLPSAVQSSQGFDQDG